MASVTVQTADQGLDVAFLNSFDYWVWIGVGRDTATPTKDTFSKVVRFNKQTRLVGVTIDVEDDSPFDTDTCEVIDFCVDFYGYLYILVAGEASSVEKVDVMKYQPTGLLIYSAYAEGITGLSTLACRIEVDVNDNIMVMTSADEASAGDIYQEVISQS